MKNITSKTVALIIAALVLLPSLVYAGYTYDVTFGSNLSSDLIPSITGTYNIGSATNQWKNLFVQNLNVSNSTVATGTVTMTGSSSSPILTVSNTGSGRAADFTAGNVNIGAALLVTGTVFSDNYGKNNDANNMVFRNRAGTQTYMAIDTAGKVGIGTTTPNANNRLTVQTSGNTSGTNGMEILDSTGGTIFNFRNDGTFFPGNGGTYITSNGMGNTGASAVMTIGGFGSSGKVALYAGSTEKVRVDSTGYVGIGVTSPSYALDIASTTATLLRVTRTGGAILRVQNGTTDLAIGNDKAASGLSLFTSGNVGNPNIYIDTNGLVGIGTSTPKYPLNVYGKIGTTQATAPALTSCGTSPAIVGSDSAGIITEGSVSTGCTMTFNSTFGTAPSCTVSSEAGLGFTYTTSATALTITNVGALSSTKLHYHCLGL